MHRGWVKLHRKIADNELWLSEKFTRGQAWVDMIMLANHQDGCIRIRGIKVKIKRGQLGWSEIALAERWQWSRGKVRRFLNELKTAQQIEQQKNRITSIITITNYNGYQESDTTDSTTNGQQTDNKRYPNKNDKNGKNEKNDKTNREKFDLPAWIPSDLWESFIDIRKAKNKKTATSTNALNLIINKLERWKGDGHNPVDILETSVMSGWAGVFEPKNVPTSGKSRASKEADKILNWRPRNEL